MLPLDSEKGSAVQSRLRQKQLELIALCEQNLAECDLRIGAQLDRIQAMQRTGQDTRLALSLLDALSASRFNHSEARNRMIEASQDR